jgi:hypothetical protein
MIATTTRAFYLTSGIEPVYAPQPRATARGQARAERELSAPVR